MTRRTSWWRSRSNAPSRDTVWPGSWIGWRAPARPAAGHPHRQRQGVLWQGDARVGTCPWRRLRLIEPGKPNPHAYVESLNGRLRDECLDRKSVVYGQREVVSVDLGGRRIMKKKQKKE